MTDEELNGLEGHYLRLLSDDPAEQGTPLQRAAEDVLRLLGEVYLLREALREAIRQGLNGK
ncbi:MULTISPECIES: hypothetical protein [Myxococcus]|uniref:Uncharacterized protein n=2 Tax=Myxococcus TaxID=32 RepID=A0A511HQB7_9BACT|nr:MULTISPECIES: hypothetical protein [Myxococcus]NOJ81837.1 hypothetical protein [Myxococcus xanthus]NOJ86964.1 hypothetical protein [Myxococcus xanthus]NOK02923.1 hypothetical protein [Myxococcus xanthus]QQR46151.1 hypothetical protein JKA73_08610 [Myxococcus xanthus]SDF36012.1 hypothetical protein SAMN04488504_1355 [Myxococcus virescens]